MITTDQIQEAIDILTNAIAGKKEPTTSFTFQLTDRDAKVLRAMCRANIRVPNAVVAYTGAVSSAEVTALLAKLQDTIGRW